MKVFLIVRSFSGRPEFIYYLSPDFMLMEHIDPIENKTTYHLLEISKIVVHHIDQNSRKVEPYDYKNIGKWSSNLSKMEFFKKSKPYLLNGRECIIR